MYTLEERFIRRPTWNPRTWFRKIRQVRRRWCLDVPMSREEARLYLTHWCAPYTPWSAEETVRRLEERIAAESDDLFKGTM